MTRALLGEKNVLPWPTGCDSLVGLEDRTRFGGDDMTPRPEAGDSEEREESESVLVAHDT